LVYAIILSYPELVIMIKKRSHFNEDSKINLKWKIQKAGI